MTTNGIEMVEVKSSTLKAVGFQGEENEGTLVVEFSGGARYHYSDVPKSLYDEMLEAPSPGRFFASSIKGQFEFVKQVGG